MTRPPRFLTPIVVALAVAAGCTGSTTMVVHDDPPPATRAERAEHRRGHVFVGGHWQRRDHRRWVWIPGHYERERPGHVYIEGRWRTGRHGHVWVDGQWRRREGVVLREARRF